jgi:N6-adenosine-specific RNA methylase IME4
MTLTPQRIQCTRGQANSQPPGVSLVWAGAGTNWDNPYDKGSPEENLALYRDMIRNRDSRKGDFIRANLFRLRYRDLGCGCSVGRPCHGDVLIELANGEAGMLLPHPFAELLPLLEGAAFDEFCADIKANGINMPVVLFEGRTLDGRNRLRAADVTGAVVPFTDFSGDEAAAFAFVHSMNYERRQLTPSQRAMYAAARGKLAVGINQHTMAGGAGGEGAQNCAPSQEQKAAAAQVSRRLQQYADTVEEKGSPALKAAVIRGDVAAATAAVIADLPAKQQDRLIAKAQRPLLQEVKQIRAARVEAKRARVVLPQSFKGGTVDDLHALAASGFKARTILADPPWKFLTRSPAGEDRSASMHYRTMTLDAIKALPIAALCDADTTLLMWMVDWGVELALEVLKAFGFTQKTTAFTWIKLNASGEIDVGDLETSFFMGPGYWTRANPEACWLATRGAPTRLNADVRQLVIAPVMEHSRKPDIHDRIERLVSGPYLELFARRERPGWVTWSDELPFALPTDADRLAHDADGVVVDEPAAPPGGEGVSGMNTPSCGGDDLPHPLVIDGVEIDAAALNTLPPVVDDTDIPAFLRRKP